MDKANCDVAPGEPNLPGGDTIYLSVVDREGNMVSLIQSNFENFGSGLVAPGTGFALQGSGALFSLDPASPNALPPRNRPLQTIIPAIIQNRSLRTPFRIISWLPQAQAHA